jgi:hypothetical protein
MEEKTNAPNRKTVDNASCIVRVVSEAHPIIP